MRKRLPIFLVIIPVIFLLSPLLAPYCATDVSCLSVVQPVFAQDAAPSGPVYVVESGDTFYSIAVQFGVTVDDIIQANPTIDPNLLSVGTEVVIPGLQGVKGKLVTRTIQLGENLRTVSIRNRIEIAQIEKLNRLVSPVEVFAGSNLIIPKQDDVVEPASRYLLSENQSLFELALLNNQNPWLLAETNLMNSTWDLLPGEAVFDSTASPGDNLSLISPAVRELTIDPLPIEQGETAKVKISTTQPVELSGSLAGRTLQFFPNGDNNYVALQGVHVMADPGIYPFSLQGTLADGTQFTFDQMVILEPLGYIREQISGVDATTIDPAVSAPEDELIKGIITPATPQRYWNGLFAVPGYDPNWITSTFGNRRSYNGGPYTYFHSGVDYGGGTGLAITAPAPGKVVFAGPLTVRGNAIIIDHGWGVYSGFWHLSEFQAKVGDLIETGQTIGLVGATGRVTGPHLHWEIWVNGVQVNPLTWLVEKYP